MPLLRTKAWNGQSLLQGRPITVLPFAIESESRININIVHDVGDIESGSLIVEKMRYD